MTRSTPIAALAALLLAILAAPAPTRAAARPIRIGVGSQGPISPQAMAQIQNLVAALPNVTMVPISPAGDVAACVKRFVAGEADDRLDALMIVSLPRNSFKAARDRNEATFTGTYEIWTLNLSTLAEDRHDFTFSDRETVTGGVGALLAMPVQLLAQRTTGSSFISGDVWQAYEAVQNRVEAKLVAATRIYLETAPIRATQPLNPMTTAHSLLASGDGATAMAVLKSVGLQRPEVQAMIVNARAQARRDAAARLLGRSLGAIAGDDPQTAARMLASYEKSPDADPSRIPALSHAIDALSAPRDSTNLDALMRTDAPNLDQSAFVAMVKQLFADRAGHEPHDVVIRGQTLVIADSNAPDALKSDLDGYADALARSAQLMSLRCGCAAQAWLRAQSVSPTLLQASFAPSSKRALVGLP